jgi:hypothetical protein
MLLNNGADDSIVDRVCYSLQHQKCCGTPLTCLGVKHSISWPHHLVHSTQLVHWLVAFDRRDYGQWNMLPRYGLTDGCSSDGAWIGWLMIGVADPMQYTSLLFEACNASCLRAVEWFVPSYCKGSLVCCH